MAEEKILNHTKHEFRNESSKIRLTYLIVVTSMSQYQILKSALQKLHLLSNTPYFAGNKCILKDKVIFKER